MQRMLLTIVFILLLTPRVAMCEAWGPWSQSQNAPTVPIAADHGPSSPASPEPAGHGILSTPFVWLITFYQKIISPIDGDRCPMYPTCSQYGLLAISKHGPAIGIIMTADRLIHEADEKQFVALKKVGSRYRYVDPVENNDFWWNQK